MHISVENYICIQTHGYEWNVFTSCSMNGEIGAELSCGSCICLAQLFTNVQASFIHKKCWAFEKCPENSGFKVSFLFSSFLAW